MLQLALCASGLQSVSRSGTATCSRSRALLSSSQKSTCGYLRVWSLRSAEAGRLVCGSDHIPVSVAPGTQDCVWVLHASISGAGLTMAPHFWAEVHICLCPGTSATASAPRRPLMAHAFPRAGEGHHRFSSTTTLIRHRHVPLFASIRQRHVVRTPAVGHHVRPQCQRSSDASVRLCGGRAQ